MIWPVYQIVPRFCSRVSEYNWATQTYSSFRHQTIGGICRCPKSLAKVSGIFSLTFTLISHNKSRLIHYVKCKILKRTFICKFHRVHFSSSQFPLTTGNILQDTINIVQYSLLTPLLSNRAFEIQCIFIDKLSGL